MSSYIDCVVDTSPMAQSINTVSGHIKGTTAAVVGMKAAVIQAEKEAADQVCEDVNKGFYTLIHSQISQKIAKLNSEVDSHVMKLNQLAKQLNIIRKRMERDYAMVSSRYIKIFNNLNKNLQQRITEIDRPIIDFVKKDAGNISNRSAQLTATVPVEQIESLSVSQKILASNLKYRGLNVINSMSNFLAESQSQNELSDHILLDEKLTESSRPIMIPIIVSENVLDREDNRKKEIFIPMEGLDSRCRTSIHNETSSNLAGMQWEDCPIDPDIKSEFSKLLENNNISDRVRDTIRSLFSANKFQTLKQHQDEL